MTGFGSGSAKLGSGQILVRARAVNHRFVDARIRLPSQFFAHLHKLDQLSRKRVERGRVEVTAELSSVPAGTLTLDRTRARHAFLQLGELRDEMAPGAPLPLSLLSSVPELFVTETSVDDIGAEHALFEAANLAFDQLNQMRLVEGENLAADLTSRSEQLRTLCNQLRERTESASMKQAERLHARVRTLIKEVRSEKLGLDQGRLELEIALLADRGDVSEELTRLTSHFDQFEDLLGRSEATGRRMEFLVQEMNREINTIGSKSTEVEAAHLVVEVKSELERVREQIQNIL